MIVHVKDASFRPLHINRLKRGDKFSYVRPRSPATGFAERSRMGLAQTTGRSAPQASRSRGRRQTDLTGPLLFFASQTRRAASSSAIVLINCPRIGGSGTPALAPIPLSRRLLRVARVLAPNSPVGPTPGLIFAPLFPCCDSRNGFGDFFGRAEGYELSYERTTGTSSSEIRESGTLLLQASGLSPGVRTKG